MNEWAGGFPKVLVNASDSLDTELEDRLRDSGTLAFRVAYGVLRHRQDAEDVAQEAFVRTHRIAVSLSIGALRAQEAQTTPVTSVRQPRPAPPIIPVRIQLVISRMQGDKKISSVPYVLWVTANSHEKSNLRMGNQIPVPDSKGGYSYRDVGTNIDAYANSGPDDTYTVTVTVNDSSVYYPDRNDPAAASATNTGVPAFRSVTSNCHILLRDGQTGQYLSATDQVSGQVLKIDAILSVVK